MVRQERGCSKTVAKQQQQLHQSTKISHLGKSFSQSAQSINIFRGVRQIMHFTEGLEVSHSSCFNIYVANKQSNIK